jgi:hypothetical protein
VNISPLGFITPQSDFYRVKNVKFYNYEFNEAAAIGSCSHCFKGPATDSDARTVKFEGLTLNDPSVTKKIRYQEPFKSIFYDGDGTLMGQAGGWTVSDIWCWNAWNGTCVSDPVYDGFVCDNTVTIRSLVLYNASPSNLVGEDLFVLPYDYHDVVLMNDTELAAYE